ncbi:MAG: hypothetical protein K6G07_00765 [Lachnospiraceae bacterium]|nr:hypothetical protein [Lachnospiraceae bacterium]
MNRKQWKKLNIDTRTATDIEQEIARLSGQYDTGWAPDFENPDIGGTLAKIYASGMEDNLTRVNEILDRYHTEFVNMLDISLLPAKPASAIVVMDLISDTIDGCPVAKGTKLLAGNGEEPYVFETDHSLYVSGSRLVNSFLADGENGTIVPLLGNFERPALPGEKGGVVLDEDEESVAPPDKEQVMIEEFQPFSLFGESEGLEVNAISFFHPVMFDTGKDAMFVRIEGNEELVEDIKNGAYAFMYDDPEEGMLPMDEVALMADQKTFRVRKDKEGGFEHLIMLAKKPPLAAKKVDRICFSSMGEAVPAEAVSSGATDFDTDRFLPFTDTLSLYAECYVGHDRYFGKSGARITMTFDLTFDENRISLTDEEEQDELKIIKRRPNAARQEVYADCMVQEVAVEYFNGTGWKKLPLSEEPRLMFMDLKARRVSLSFICPDDWEETESGSYSGRAIRFNLLKSDNCYVRPAVHHYPIIRNLMLSYTYEDHYVDAYRADLYYGTKVKDITEQLKNEKGYIAFEKCEYEDDALYLGFSKRIENGPASILFQLEDGMRFSGLKCRFEYLGYDGWRQMKVLDYTQEFTRSGVIMFMPPSDMKQSTLEGHSCYWLRVVRVKKEADDEDRTALPKIINIIPNAVQVSNIETRQEVPIYIDEAVPNMRFALGTQNVLDADVWVNEMGKYSRDIMLRKVEEDPDNIRVEYDPQGQITAFFVRWHETERFEVSDDPRVYELDRLQNELIFGDGIHTAIPRVTDDIAVRFTIRCCNGQRGNVPADAISEPLENINFIGSITNPIRAYGGSNIESVENALARGAGLLSSRNRLVSLDDYKRAILSYSDTIDQVTGIVGETIEGKEDASQITFLLLMKDYAEGSYAFHRIVGGLKKELLQRAELTVAEDKFHLMEPIYVDVSVSVWVDVVSIDDSFEIQNLLRECLESYLDPLGYGKGHGWKIGTMPKKPQILMRLNVLKSRVIVKKSVMIAHYTDASGEHEVDLEELKVTPFMVPRSGKHDVHIIY